ncbi:Lipolysis-activating peptide 1-alpha chain [Bienertia sinuspersici]
MLVKKPTRNRGQPKKKEIEKGEQPNPQASKADPIAKTGGSRFEILNDEAELQSESNAQNQEQLEERMEIVKIPELMNSETDENDKQESTYTTVQLGENSQSTKIKANDIFEKVKAVKSNNMATDNAKIKDNSKRILAERNNNIPHAKT